MYIDKKQQPETGNNNVDDDEDDEDKRIIFCANLNERCTEEILYELFIQGGPIESVRIPKDKDGRQKTFGFVHFRHRCSVPYVLELFDGVKLFNQRLVLKPKQNSNNNSAGKSFAYPPVPRFHIENNDTRNRGDGKNFSDNSSLRFGGGQRAINPTIDASLMPKETEPKMDRNRNNPFNVELLSRLGADFLLNIDLKNTRNDYSSSRNNDQNHISKYASRNNKQQQHSHNNNPYKRPQSSKDGNRKRGHSNRGDNRRR